MLGLIIATVYAAFLHFVSGNSDVTAYLSATNFLYWWYIITSSILGVILLLLTFFISTVTTVAGEEAGGQYGKSGGMIGGLAGLAVGGGISALMIVIQTIRCGALIGGAWLLNHAVALDGVWDNSRLIWGAIAILLGLVMSRSSGSSSSNRNKNKSR